MKKIIICNLIIVLLFFILFNFIFLFNAFCINKPGKIFISSTPSGAKIYLDYKYKGITPQILSNLNPGRYLVKLTKSGYQDYSKSVTVFSDKTTFIKADLVTVSGVKTTYKPGYKPGKIFLTSNPSGAKIYLNSEYQEGITPSF